MAQDFHFEEKNAPIHPPNFEKTHHLKMLSEILYFPFDITWWKRTFSWLCGRKFRRWFFSISSEMSAESFRCRSRGWRAFHVEFNEKLMNEKWMKQKLKHFPRNFSNEIFSCFINFRLINEKFIEGSWISHKFWGKNFERSSIFEFTRCVCVFVCQK